MSTACPTVPVPATPIDLAEPVIRLRLSSTDLERIDAYRLPRSLPRSVAARILLAEALNDLEAAA